MMTAWSPTLDPDPNEQLACDACGWRGRRRDLTVHPRQGFGVCPRCWRNGYERMARALTDREVR